MKLHASRRVIPAPTETQEEFNSDDFFENDFLVSRQTGDEETLAGYEIPEPTPSLMHAALKLLGR